MLNICEVILGNKHQCEAAIWLDLSCLALELAMETDRMDTVNINTNNFFLGSDSDTNSRCPSYLDLRNPTLNIRILIRILNARIQIR
jgi:hypothetical protein